MDPILSNGGRLSRTATLLSLVTLVLAAGPALAAPRARNVAALEEMVQRFQARHEAEQAALRAAPADHPVIRAYRDNPNYAIVGMDADGQPIIHKFDGLVAAQTISSDQVWPAGPAGFSLDGDRWGHGYLAMWDSGSVLLAHQEFGGRISQVDSPANPSSHSTRVAGILIAAGVNPAAVGMSPNSELYAFDSTNDDAEMANQALINLHVSNHSYSTLSGWDNSNGFWVWNGRTSISTQEDYKFGQYSQGARDWDEIAFNAPYYLIVGGAGNDRNDTGPAPGTEHIHYTSGGTFEASFDTHPADGGATGFDTMPPSKTGKNILTVGGVNDIAAGYAVPSDVVATAFADWGPTDDGRIKPDVVANALNLTTTDNLNNTSYTTTASGCSFAGPGVAGSVNLMLQHWNDTHGGQEPLSSTLKAILVHTADEAGPAPGPDYMFGWGLVNTRAAVELIDADIGFFGARRIIEGDLTDGGSDEYTFWWDGESPFDVTLAWIDPPGVVGPDLVDVTTPRLVNDLDLRVERTSGSVTYLPWFMFPLQPAVPPIRADNDLDNVEQVTVDNPSAGYFTVIVEHEGSLDGGSQDYSLIMPAREHVCLTAEPIGSPSTLLDVPGTVQHVLDLDGDARLDQLIINLSLGVVINRNEGGGLFSRMDPSGFAGLGPIADLAWEDIDRDGDLDAFVSINDGTSNTVMLAQGGGIFNQSNVATTQAADVTDVVFADIDADGDADVYQCVKGGPNRTFTYDAQGNFNRVPFPPLAYAGDSEQACFANIDGDRWPELYLVNSDGPNVLLDYDGNSWQTIDMPAGSNASFGAAWFDSDNDGDLDLYVANDPAEGDQLLRRTPAGFVIDTLPSMGPPNGSRPGVVTEEYNNDGFTDLWIPHYGISLVKTNGSWTIVQMTMGSIDINAAAIWDALGNGKPVSSVCGDSGGTLNFNDPCDPDSRWLEATVRSDIGSVVGANVLVQTGGGSFRAVNNQKRQVGTGNGARGNAPTVLHFGVGAATNIDRVRVEWPDGSITDLFDIGPDQRILIEQGVNSTDAPVVAAGSTTISELLPNSPNPFRDRTDVRFQLGQRTRVELAIYSVAGRLVRRLAEGHYEPGTHTIAWDGRDTAGSRLASGVYFARLQGEGVSATRRVVLLK